MEIESRTRCNHCGSSEIDRDPSRGDAVCTGCGSVLEESIIVSEVQFAQDCHGATRAVGQLVTAESNVACGLNLGHGFGLTKESRMITLQNAKKKITDLANKLVLPNHCIAAAHNFYKLALAKKFTQGRKNAHVIAACVYLVCRQEETPHMLLDISDILQINVYELGKTYLKLQTELCINTPTIDPSMYILRFSHQLGFEKQVQAVAFTASRLVQRMKRDWMHTGRRPSGLCGAALLVAARMHNFNRTVGDIIKVVKVCQATVRKRLTEFSDTPSSRLTLTEFMDIDLEEEQDPPAFKAARRKKLVDLEEHKMKEAEQQIIKLRKEIETSLETFNKKKVAVLPQFLTSPESTESEEGNLVSQFIAKGTMETIDEVLGSEKEQHDLLSNTCKLESMLVPIVSRPESDEADLNRSDKLANDPDMVDANCELDISGLDEEEIDSYILTNEEIRSKAKYWLTLNGPFLKQQKEKQEKRKREEEKNAKKEPKKKRLRQKRGPVNVSTTGEAIEKILQQKKISLKLDYNVLKNLNAETVTDPQVQVTKVESPQAKGKPARKRVYKPKPQPIIPSSIRNDISALVKKSRLQRNSVKLDEDEMEEKDPVSRETIDLDTPSTSETVPSIEEEITIKDGQGDEDADCTSQDEEEEDDDDDMDGSQYSMGLFGNTMNELEYYEYDDE